MCLYLILAGVFAFIPAIFLGDVFGGTGAGSATGNVIQGATYSLLFWIGLTVIIFVCLVARGERKANKNAAAPNRDGGQSDAAKQSAGVVHGEEDGVS